MLTTASCLLMLPVCMATLTHMSERQQDLLGSDPPLQIRTTELPPLRIALFLSDKCQVHSTIVDVVRQAEGVCVVVCLYVCVCACGD